MQVIGGRVKEDVGNRSAQWPPELHLLHRWTYWSGHRLHTDPRPVMESKEDPRVGPVCPTILGPDCPLQVKHLMHETVGPHITIFEYTKVSYHNCIGR